MQIVDGRGRSAPMIKQIIEVALALMHWQRLADGLLLATKLQNGLAGGQEGGTDGGEAE